MNNLQKQPRKLETGISEFLLDVGESAFDKREYLNAAGKKKKKKKKIKKIRKKKKVVTKNGETAEITVDVPVEANEDGSPLTKEEVAKNAAIEKKAVAAEIKSKNINLSNVSEVKNADSKNGSEADTNTIETPKEEMILGMPKMVFYGGAAVVGVLFVFGVAMVFKGGKKENQ